jgi:hypothetical protein
VLHVLILRLPGLGQSFASRQQALAAPEAKAEATRVRGGGREARWRGLRSGSRASAPHRASAGRPEARKRVRETSRTGACPARMAACECIYGCRSSGGRVA